MASRRIGAVVLVALLAAPVARADEPPDPTTASEEASDDVLLDDGLDVFDQELEAAAIPDPIEPVNRKVFAGNRFVDQVLLDPITRAYGWIVPGPIKRGVRNVFDNLNQPVVIANDLLQLEPRLAAGASVRFLLNSTFGIAGIFDPALEAGFPAHRSDFGQTLARYGVGPGIYLVLPLLGPNSTRDAVGSVVDLALRPDTWLLPIPPRLLLGGTWGISEREEHLEKLDALEASSVDFYAAIRSAYWMDRQAFVHERDEPPRRASRPPLPRPGAIAAR